MRKRDEAITFVNLVTLAPRLRVSPPVLVRVRRLAGYIYSVSTSPTGLVAHYIYILLNVAFDRN